MTWWWSGMSERTVHLVMRDWWETSVLCPGRRLLLETSVVCAYADSADAEREARRLDDAEIVQWLADRGFVHSHRVEEVTLHG